jgi:arylsulfatase A
MRWPQLRSRCRHGARRRPGSIVALALAVAACLASTGRAPAADPAPQPRKPNVVLIFIDDLGYGDIGPFGAQGYETPHLNRMAAQGMKFTDFVVSSAVCSASRAALMTGCYHRRVGIDGALGPQATIGINSSETTLAEICRQQGYATAVFGKWHLGHHPKFLPLEHGFDEYFGLPYSNDMWPYHPEIVNKPLEQRLKFWPNLPLIENAKVIDADVTADDQPNLTTWYTEHAVDFIRRHKQQPFFLYVPHSMVHVPLFVSDKFKGKSSRGLFGDVVMEVDWSVGQILSAIQQSGLDDNTLVIFTADNGPWLSYGDHAGSAGPLREGKGTEFEGGIREATLMRWHGMIPATATCDELASTIDILPTVAALVGGKLPEHKIDGHDIRKLMFGEPGARSPHEAFYCYYNDGELQAVRDPRWKLHFPHGYATLAGQPGGVGGRPAKYTRASIGLALFDLKNDIGEITDVADQHPEIVERLSHHADVGRQDLGDKLTRQPATGARQPGRLTPEDARLVW